jgi:hypothetical protein
MVIRSWSVAWLTTTTTPACAAKGAERQVATTCAAHSSGSSRPTGRCGGVEHAAAQCDDGGGQAWACRVDVRRNGCECGDSHAASKPMAVLHRRKHDSTVASLDQTDRPGSSKADQQDCRCLSERHNYFLTGQRAAGVTPAGHVQRDCGRVSWRRIQHLIQARVLLPQLVVVPPAEKTRTGH